MSMIKITDLDGNYVNQITADLASAEEVYPNHQYEEIVDIELTMEDMMSAPENARFWRDEELQSSDWIVPTSDHPQHAAYITYRAALRSWPADEANFPDTKPTLGE